LRECRKEQASPETFRQKLIAQIAARASLFIPSVERAAVRQLVADLLSETG